MERIEPEFLLTSASSRTVALGVVATVVGGIAVPLSLPALCFAVGLAFGHQSLSGPITVLLAVFGGVVLAALVGVTLSLGRKLAALRSPRLRRYRTLLYAAGFAVLVIAWFLLASDAVGWDRLASRLPVVPITWIADLGLLGLPGSEPVGRRPVGAICLFGVGLPLCTVAAIGSRTGSGIPIRSAPERPTARGPFSDPGARRGCSAAGFLGPSSPSPESDGFRNGASPGVC